MVSSVVGDLVNAFCPTGAGGGVNPSCSPNGEGGRTYKDRAAKSKMALSSAKAATKAVKAVGIKSEQYKTARAAENQSAKADKTVLAAKFHERAERMMRSSRLALPKGSKHTAALKKAQNAHIQARVAHAKAAGVLNVADLYKLLEG